MPNLGSNPGMEDTVDYKPRYSPSPLDNLPKIRLSESEKEDPCKVFERPEFRKRIQDGERLTIILRHPMPSYRERISA